MGRRQGLRYRREEGGSYQLLETVITTNLARYPDSGFIPQGFTLLPGLEMLLTLSSVKVACAYELFSFCNEK